MAIKYKLHPLIMYESHPVDHTSTYILTKDLSDLYAMGYRAIAIEWDERYNIEAGLAKMKNVKQDFSEKISITKGYLRSNSFAAKQKVEIKKELKFLTLWKEQYELTIKLIVKAQKIGFAIYYIDPQDINEAAKFEYEGDAKAINEANIWRDKYMAQSILDLAAKNEGGVICVNGATHKDLQIFIDKYIADNQKSISSFFFGNKYDGIQPLYFLGKDDSWCNQGKADFVTDFDHCSITAEDNPYLHQINILEHHADGRFDSVVVKLKDLNVAGDNQGDLVIEEW